MVIPPVHKQDGPGPEAVLPAPRQTISYYLVLALIVTPFRAVTPASWCYVLYSLYTGSIWSYTSKQLSLFVVAIAEVGTFLYEDVTSDEPRERAHTQVFFSIYHYHLAKLVSGSSPIRPGNTVDLQVALRRVLQAGLAGLQGDGPYDDETLDFDHPGSPAEVITALAFDDPRAVDFRSCLRTW